MAVGYFSISIFFIWCRYLDTTYGIDYRDTYPYAVKKSEQTPPPEMDNTAAYKKCHSQFTDVDDHRRLGRNTWHDESGAYANAELKSEVFKPTDTIPERLQWWFKNYQSNNKQDKF